MDTKEISISWDPDPARLSIFRRNSNNKVWTEAAGLFGVSGHVRGISSELRSQSIFSDECNENKHQQQFVFLQPCIISCLPLAFDHTRVKHTYTHTHKKKNKKKNLHHPPTPPSFLHHPSSNETFIFQSIMVESETQSSCQGHINPKPRPCFQKH